MSEVFLAIGGSRWSSFNGPNLSAIDPATNELVRLFHPRTDKWDEHFAIVGLSIEGLTAIGRATALLLQMNDENRMEIRSALAESGEWP